MSKQVNEWAYFEDGSSKLIKDEDALKEAKKNGAKDSPAAFDEKDEKPSKKAEKKSK